MLTKNNQNAIIATLQERYADKDFKMPAGILTTPNRTVFPALEAESMPKVDEEISRITMTSLTNIAEPVITEKDL